MKKSLLLLSVLATLAGAAAAQSSVTMYGVLDAGLNVETPPSSAPGSAGNQYSLASGISTPSRIGFKGSEEFGASLKALFQLEAGVQLNNGQSTETGTLFNRASWIGLSGDFGMVMLGRQFTPMYNAVYSIDPFELGMAGNAGNLMQLGGANAHGANVIGGSNLLLDNGGGSMTQNSSMRYVSHVDHGFSLEFNYGLGGQPGNFSDAAETGYLINYENGPLHLLAAYDAVNAVNNSNTFKTKLAGGMIDWSVYGVPLKTSFGYQTNKGADLIGAGIADTTSLLLGLRIPVGRHEVLFSYVHLNDKNSPGYGASQFALGYTYALSNRTSFYTSVGEMLNKNGADYTLGNASSNGYGVKAFDLGIRHSF